MTPLNKCQERAMVGCEYSRVSLTRRREKLHDESRASEIPEGHNVSYRGDVNRSGVRKNILTRVIFRMWFNSLSVSCHSSINQFN